MSAPEGGVRDDPGVPATEGGVRDDPGVPAPEGGVRDDLGVPATIASLVHCFRFAGLLGLRRTAGADLDLGLPTRRFFAAGISC